MQAVGFKAWCPYEIGDCVRAGQKVMQVTDIITQMSARTGKVIFILELDKGETYAQIREQQ